ncbi:MAG: HEPN domain-containing protein [Sulfurimonas sp.]|jgi:HEPN domain-containing protein
MNKTAGIEWLEKGWHHLSTAQILDNCNHYTDIIGVELHYSIEIVLKAILAYENLPIKKTHELYDLYLMVNDYIEFNDDEIALLLIATKYHILEAYPAKDRRLPPKEEIKPILEFAEHLMECVCTQLNISIEEIKSEPN